MTEETIKSFMVSLGWENNDVEYRKFESALTSATTKGILLGEAIEETARKVAGAITAVAEHFEKLGYIGERSGASIKNIESLEFAFSKVGVSVGETDAAIQAMARRVRDGGPGMVAMARQLGYEFDGAGKFIRINAEALKAVKDMAPSTAALYADKAGLPDNMLTASRLHADAILASIKQNNASIDAAGLNPEKAAADAIALNNNIRDLEQKAANIANGLADRLMNNAIPSLEKLNKWVDANQAGIAGGLNLFVDTFGKGLVQLGTDIDALKTSGSQLEQAAANSPFGKWLLGAGAGHVVDQDTEDSFDVLGKKLNFGHLQSKEELDKAAADSGPSGWSTIWNFLRPKSAAPEKDAQQKHSELMAPFNTRGIALDGSDPERPHKQIGLERADDKIFGSGQSRSLEHDSGPTKGLSGSWNDFANALTFGLAGKDQIKVNGQPVSTSNPMPVTLGQSDKLHQEWDSGRGGDGLGGGTGGASLGDAGRRGGTLPPDGQAAPLPDTRTPWQKYAPKILGGKDAPTTKTGPSGVAYTAKSLTEAMGINQKEYDAFREGLTDIEGKKYNRMGGAGGHYAGRYQMGPNEISDTARRLGVARPTNEQFLGDPALQEKFFENYTLDHYRELLKNPKFAAMSHKQQLQILGYAHNQGVGSSRRGTGAMGYLDSGRSGADAWGTSGTAYFGPIGRRYDKAMADATGQAEKATHAAPVAKPSPLKAETPARGDDEDDDDPFGEDEKRAADKPKTNQAPTHPQPAPPARAPSEWSAPAPTVYDASRIKGALNSVGLGGQQSEQIIANHIKAQTPAAQGDVSNDSSIKNSHNNVNQKVEIHVAGSDDSAGVARMIESHVTREFSDLTSNLKSAAQ